MRPTACLPLLLGLLAGAARAQAPATPAPPWGTWLIGTAVLPGATGHRWGGFAEGQARTDGLFHHYFYNELKVGGSFDLDPNFILTVAGGRYQTSDYHDLGAGPLNVEKRLWQQLVLTQLSHRLKLEHRYRLEQRWFDFRDGSTEFRQRLRYRLHAFLPLNKPRIEPGTVFLGAYDEIFLNPRGPVFERNRVYVGVGYQWGPHLVLQAGYVNQTNYNYTAAVTPGQLLLQSTAAKNNVVLNVLYKFGRRPVAGADARPVEKLPSQPD